MIAEPLAFHNGRFIPQSELTLGFHDAGFVFGATVTDFCRTYRHKLFRWTDHLARLRRDCERCFVPLPFSDEELNMAAEKLIEENTKSLAATDDLAVLTFVTPGCLGYMLGLPENGPPTVGMHTYPIPIERYRRFFTEGVVLEVVGAGTTLENSELVSTKHRSRIHWWLAGRQLKNANAIPTLTGVNGVPDTPIGAVLSVIGGKVLAPEPGTVLDSISMKVVAELCQAEKIPFEYQTDWSSSDSWDESERLLTGSAFGVAGVRRSVRLTRSIDMKWPGPVYQKLAAAWSKLVGLDIAKQFTR